MKRLVKYVLLPISLLIVLTVLQNCGLSKNEKTAKIEQLVNYCYDNGIFNGSILVAEKSKIIYNQAKGFANFATQERLKTDSPLYLAAVSKQFTAMAIMILKEQRKLNYSDPLANYFPEFPEYAEKITIRNLLNHTSGIADHFNAGLNTPELTNREVLEFLVQRKEPEFKPDEQYGYSNGGYVLLALIVETVSGKPLRQFMKENIFDPLQMEHTFVYDESKPALSNRAFGYDLFGAQDDYHILTTGDGGIFSTAEDLFKWDQALYSEKLVSAQTLEEAFTPALLLDGISTGYGFGWGITEIGSYKIISHGGGLGGFRAYIERHPSTKNTIIVLSNIGDAVPTGQLSQAIRSILSDSEIVLPQIPIALKMFRIIQESGISQAIEKYRMLKVNEPKRYDFTEAQLNGLGYHYLHQNEIDQAIEIFKLNVREFPESANVYDSLGEAYFIKKEFVLASENYKKSLALNPKNANAIRMFERIAKEK